MPGMDVLRRVRWENVGRAAAAVLALGVVIAWPRLAPDAPRVPAAGLVPLDRGPRHDRTTGAERPTLVPRARRRAVRRRATRRRSVRRTGRRDALRRAKGRDASG